MKTRWFWMFIFVAIILYGRSLPYEFVYDDHWRVQTNPAITRLSNILSFFSDRRTQSSNPALHRDSYRPLTTVSFAIDYALWGYKPWGYRLVNILLHGLNGWLVALLGVLLLGLSTPAALLGGLFFLAHPVQTESVVWIVERSNVLNLTLMFGGTISWIYLLKSSNQRWAFLSHFFLIAALLTREIAVCLPIFLFFVRQHLASREQPIRLLRLRPRSDLMHLGLMLVVVAVYLLVRTLVLGQVKISGYWGGSPALNLAHVFLVWPQYLRVLVWPHPLQITYAGLAGAAGWFEPGVIFGTILFAIFSIGAIILRKRSPRVSLCIFSFFLFWLPGSNLVPLTTLFAERLIYPLLPWVGLLGGIFVDRKTNKINKVIFGGMIAVLSLVTFFHLPAWKNELALWTNATQASPGSWFAWANLGQEQRRLNQLSQAHDSIMHALKLQVPVEAAGVLFFELARLDLKNRNQKMAEENARRAIQLRPDLKPLWKNEQERDLIRSPSEP